MGTVRIIVLVVAALAAIGLAFVVRRMAAGHRAPAPVAVAAPAPTRPSVQVLTAKHDLAIGTRVSPADLSWSAWPAGAINPAYITDGATPTTAAAFGATAAKAATLMVSGGGAMQALSGAIVREPILSGEPIVERKLVRGGQGGYMSVVLQPGMRAVSVPVTVESGAGGFILPGDRVDVVMTRKGDQGGGGGASAPSAVADTVLRNVRVVAIDQRVEPDKNAKAIVGSTATLETPAGDVEMLLRSKAQGELSLVLRSYADLGGASGAMAARASTIRIVRAGHISEATVQ